MVAFSGSGAPTPIERILRTTAQHFSLHVLGTQLRLDRGEFIDPRPLRWSEVQPQIAHTQEGTARSMS